MMVIIAKPMMVVIVKGAALAEGVKRRMIEQAALSLASKGLQRTSFTEVLEASGAPRGSLYHHFPGGKEELILAALDLTCEWAMNKMASSPGASAVETAQSFLDLWRGVLLRSDFGAGCAVAAVTVAAEAPDLVARTTEIFRKWRLHLSCMLQQGGVAAPRADALATMLIAGGEGAVLLARAERSIEPFEQTERMLVELIAEEAGAKRRTRRRERKGSSPAR